MIPGYIFSLSVMSAHSVGSPSMAYPDSVFLSDDSLHFHAILMSFWRRGLSILPSISPLVRVPVLSEHIVVTAQSVSTEESFLTTTDLPASTVAQSARAIVIVVGSHSGTAAIAIDTAYMRLSTSASVPSR